VNHALQFSRLEGLLATVSLRVSNAGPFVLFWGKTFITRSAPRNPNWSVGLYSPEANPSRVGPNQRKNQIGSRPGLVLNVLNTYRLIAARTEQTKIIENARL
jgi:hypothetical protein